MARQRSDDKARGSCTPSIAAERGWHRRQGQRQGGCQGERGGRCQVGLGILGTVPKEVNHQQCVWHPPLNPLICSRDPPEPPAPCDTPAPNRPGWARPYRVTPRTVPCTGALSPFNLCLDLAWVWLIPAPFQQHWSDILGSSTPWLGWGMGTWQGVTRPPTPDPQLPLQHRRAHPALPTENP